MNVVIDGRPLVGKRTGIAVHTAEIAARLNIDPPPLIASHAEITDREGIERCRFRVDRAPNGILWQQLLLPRIPADVLWGPHGTIPVMSRVPAVITLHDFTSLTMPERHRLNTVVSYNLFIGRSIARAARIAAVSRATAHEAMRGFGIPLSRIEIVPNGVDEFFTAGGEEGDYILFAGTLEPRKGIDDLVAAWSSLPEPRPRLVLAGDGGWSGVAHARMRTSAGQRMGTSALPPGIEITGYVSRERLRELYRGARLFVYPSHYEGFGIPPLEAMACGAAVIATRTGAIPEYAEGAALLVPPGDGDALRAAMMRALSDADLRAELRVRAAERATHYRWDRSASLMRELLASAIR